MTTTTTTSFKQQTNFFFRKNFSWNFFFSLNCPNTATVGQTKFFSFFFRLLLLRRHLKMGRGRWGNKRRKKFKFLICRISSIPGKISRGERGREGKTIFRSDSISRFHDNNNDNSYSIGEVREGGGGRDNNKIPYSITIVCFFWRYRCNNPLTLSRAVCNNTNGNT